MKVAAGAITSSDRVEQQPSKRESIDGREKERKKAADRQEDAKLAAVVYDRRNRLQPAGGRKSVLCQWCLSSAVPITVQDDGGVGWWCEVIRQTAVSGTTATSAHYSTQHFSYMHCPIDWC